jgi:PAS domain S-box-containing protein
MEAKHTILIVDDDPMARKTLSDILGVKGYAPIAVATAAAALEKISEEPPAVAVVDLRLEDMSGLELIGQIRKRAPGTECIVLTGHASQASAIEAVNLGAYGYLQKPYDVEQLLIAIRRALERRADREALRASEEMYRTMAETVPDVVVMTDLEGRITYASRRAAALYGSESAQELLGRSAFEFIAPEDHERAMANLRKTLEEGAVRDVEYALLTQDGTRIPAELSAATIRDASGKAVALVAIIRDVTERVRAEEALREREELYRTLFENAPLGLGIADANGNLIAFNDAMLRPGGYDREDIIGIGNVAKLYYDPDERSKTLEIAHQQGFLDQGGVQFRCKDGAPYDTLLSLRAVQIEGRFYWLAMMEDITARKRAQQALQESEERYHTVFEQAADSIVLIDIETGALAEFNDRAHQNLGYTREEFQKLKISDFEIIESAEQVAAHIQKVVQEGSDIFETKHRTKDGQVRNIWVSSRAISIRGKDFIHSIWIDITERKQAEERIFRQSAVLEGINRVFQEALVCETSAQVASICLAVAEELTASEFGFIGELNRVGLFDTTAISDPGWDACRMPHSDAVKLTQNMAIRGIDRATLRGGESRIVNDPASHPDSVGLPEGHPPVTCFLGVPLRQSGRTIGMIGLANKDSGYDLADQEDVEALSVAFVEALIHKRAEERQRESEERYRTLIDTFPVAVVTMDLEGRVTYASRRTVEQYGAERAEALLGMSAFELIAPEEREKARATIEKTLADGLVRKAEYDLTRRDGTRFVGELNVGRLVLAGEPVGFVAVIRDVTERVQAENALRASEQRYRGLFDGVPVSLYRTTPDGRILDANSALVELLGYPDRESLLAVSAADLFADPEARVRQQALLERAGEIRDFEVRLRRCDGTAIWAEDSGRIVRNADGQETYYEGSLKDISERKRAEEALRERQQRLEFVVEHSPDSVFLQDADLRYVWVSKPAYPLTLEEYIGNTDHDLAPSEDAERLTAIKQQVIAEGRGTTVEIPLTLKGQHRTYDATYEPWRDAQGQVVGLAGYVRDVTERVQAEEDLQKLAQIVEHSRELVGLSTLDGTIVFLNEAGAQMLGVTPGEAARYTMMDFVPEDFQEQVQQELLPAVMERSVWQGDLQYQNIKTGERTGVSATAFMIPDPRSGEPLYLANVSLDITERVRAEEERERLLVTEREQRLLAEALREVTAAVNSSLERQEVLSLALKHLSLLVECDSVVVMLRGGDGLEIVARWSADPERESRVPPQIETLPHVACVLGECQPVIIPDTAADERWIEVSGSEYVRCWLGVPLIVQEKAIGLLGLNHRQPGFYTREHSDLALAVASQAASAIENARLLAAAREKAQQVQQILRTVPEGIVLLDAELRIVVVNPVGQEYLEAVTDARPGEVLAHLGGRPLAELLSPPPAGRWHTIEVKGPPSRVFELAAQPVGGETERSGWVLVLRDVTEERRVEEQMRQRDRLAAIGQLAGGVAHDFNNVLTAIEGYTELALGGLASDDPQDWPSGREMRADLGEVVKAAERAAGLTRQLLAFSRRQVLQPRVLDLNTVIAGFEKMLHRLLGEDIALVTFLAPELGRVEADPGQIEQVIMNLAVNARDAMPGGGQLTLETANVILGEIYARAHIEVEPGPYVMLAVSDMGVGMSEEVKGRIFEPFFTTKEEDEGTGLGLSVVHGIVKQSGGHISVYSEPGVGTTFKVYLPRVEKEAEVAERERVPSVPLGGTETVLVAEDEEAVRALACRVLREHGYTVLEAGHPEDALRLAGEHTGPIHLLLTDVVMPGMSGRELAERLLPSHPETALLYISGYTDNAIVHHGVLESGVPFLQKPFTPVTLARKVREVLDASLPGELFEQSLAGHDAQRLRAGVEIPETPAVSLTRESVAGLPADLVAEMREATINADIDRLSELIDRVETRDAQVAAGLRALASRYQNDTLLALFDAGEGEP